MLLATPIGVPPRFLGGRNFNLQGLGATCRVDASTVRGSDGSIWPDKSSTYPVCGSASTYSEQYKSLQSALLALSAALNDPRINPGNADGMLVNGLPSDQTMTAIAIALPHLKSKLSPFTAAALTVALSLGATTSTAKNAIKGQMGPLAVAIAAIAALKSGSGGGGGALMLPTPWYKTWWGAGALAIGGVGLLYFLTQRRSA